MKKLFHPIIPENINNIKDILTSGNIMDNSYNDNFEYLIKKFLKLDYFLSCSSYENAVWLALKVAKLSPGDEIITSPLCCLASSQPLNDFGLKINWCDVNPEFGVPGIKEINDQINDKTKAVIYNSFCGYSLELDKIYDLCKQKDITLIIDAIEGFGSKFKNEFIGSSFCDITVYNFHTVRTLNAIEAGGVSVNESLSYEHLKLLRDYGIDRKNFRTKAGEISKKVDIEIIGRGAKLNAVNSYVGSQNIKQMNKVLEKCYENKLKWDILFNEKYKNIASPLKISNNLHHNCWIYGVLSDDVDLLKKIFDKEGIETSKIHFPNNRYSIFPNKKLNGVIKFFKRFLALPCGYHFSHDN